MSETEMTADVARQLTGLARRLQDHPDFMSQILSTYQKQERLDDEALAAHLNTTPEKLIRLALCRRPNPASAEFADQIRQIASFTGIDLAQIASMVRQVDGLLSLVERPKLPGSQEATSNQIPLGSGLLAAARDRVDVESDQAPTSKREEEDQSSD